MKITTEQEVREIILGFQGTLTLIQGYIYCIETECSTCRENLFLLQDFYREQSKEKGE